jgi:hypothetical protein
MRVVLRAVPLVLSTLAIAAHFFRAGMFAIVLFVLVAPLLVITREKVLIRIVQLLLLAAAAEWIRTAVVLAHERIAYGLPVTRMLVILGMVALLTTMSALPLPRLAKR